MDLKGKRQSTNIQPLKEAGLDTQKYVGMNSTKLRSPKDLKSQKIDPDSRVGVLDVGSDDDDGWNDAKGDFQFFKHTIKDN